MTKLQLISAVDGRVHAERLPLRRDAAKVAVADARAAQKLWATRRLSERIALVKARVSKLIENKSALSCLGFHAVTRIKSYHLKKVTK